MTKNNLREHLGWYIGCSSLQPQQPAYAPPSVGLTTAFGLCLVDQSPPQGLENFAEEPRGVQVATNNAGALQAEPDFLRPLLPASVMNRDPMARLQSGPKSTNKPRLLSETIPVSLQTPTPSSVRAPGTSLKDQYSAQWERRATGTCPLLSR